MVRSEAVGKASAELQQQVGGLTLRIRLARLHREHNDHLLRVGLLRKRL